MTYREKLIETMTDISRDPLIVHIGYNVRYGRMGGILAGVPENQLIEMPLAENLMVGVAMGMSIRGYKPVVHFERMDFITNALDAIINHLDKMKKLSHGEYNPTVILRCVVGNKKNPLYTGLTHTQDLTDMMQEAVNFPVMKLLTGDDIAGGYKRAVRNLGSNSAMLVEYKDNYESKITDRVRG